MISPTHVSVYNILFHFCFFFVPQKKGPDSGWRGREDTRVRGRGADLVTLL